VSECDVTKKPGSFPDFQSLPVNSSYSRRTVHRFTFDIRLAAACDGMLNSSVSRHTTHTHTTGTGAEHYNNHHQVLIGAIISALNDLSIHFEELISDRLGGHRL
jgi:hypothetical protein